MGKRKHGMRYWGPVLVIVGLAIGACAPALIRGDALPWVLVASGLVVLTGVVLIGAARLDAVSTREALPTRTSR